MKQKPQDELQTYEKQLLQRLQSAQQRAQQARDEQMYYRGQTDALSDALSDIRNFIVETDPKFSSLTIQSAPEQRAAPEMPPVDQSLITPAHEIMDIPEEEVPVAPKRRGRRKKQAEIQPEEIAPPKKRGRKPAPTVPKTVYQMLAREAIDLKVLPRKASWFYHELLPHGSIKGLYQLEKLLEEDMTFRESIQAACAEKKAFIPAVDESLTTNESTPEQPEETTDQAVVEQPMATTDEPAPEQAVAVTEKKPRRRRKQAETLPKEKTTPQKRGRKPAAPSVQKISEFQQLAREAVDLGVFTRKASWFYHKLLPQGLIKGLYQLEKFLERDVVLREAIQAECAEKKAFVPAEEIVTAIEPLVEPFQDAA